jgi:hypothetical protein
MSAFCASTNVLQVSGLTAEIQNEFVNDAIVTVTIKDANGVELGGQTWPLAMAHVPGSNGDYRAFLAATLPFISKQNYTAFIDANDGANRVGHWEFHFRPTSQAVTA